MLKISEDADGDTVVFILEGSLSGPWVQEFERAWQTAADGRRCRRMKANLSAVTFVSREAKELLERLFLQGADLFSSDVLTKAIVDAITRKHRRSRK